MKLLRRVWQFMKDQPARVYAAGVAVVALLAAYGIDLPADAWLGLLAAALALAGGEAVQRVENGKTDRALEGKHE